MGFTIFYAWQSDRPANLNRSFIQRAAEIAVDALQADAEIEEAPRLDHDTKDTPGTPEITKTILDKIERCGIFLADLTFVGRTDSAKEGDMPKLLPNPNVIFELGHAARCVGWDRIILVMNTEFGPPEELPFDLRNRRFPICYRAVPREGDRSPVRVKLAKTLEEAFRGIIQGDMVRSEQEAAKVREATAARIGQERAAFERDLKAGRFHGLKTKDGIIAVSIIPEKSPAKQLDLPVVRRHPQLTPGPFGSGPFGTEIRARSLISFDNQDARCRYRITELTDYGIIRAADRMLLEPDQQWVAKEQAIHGGRVRGGVAATSLESDIIGTVYRHITALKELGVKGPWHVAISLLQVEGYVMLARARLMGGASSRVYDQEDMLTPPVVIPDEIDLSDHRARELARLLQPAFDFIWREFNYDRSFNYTKDGEWAPRN
jgi:hypothetical protein